MMRTVTVVGDPPVVVVPALIPAFGAFPGVMAAAREALLILVVSHLLVQITGAARDGGEEPCRLRTRC